MTRTKMACAVALCGLIALIATSWVSAAYHVEAPGTTADPAADIDDLYAWHTDDGKLVLIMTFAGLQAPAADQAAMLDRDVLYAFNIDTDGDNATDESIEVRFAQNGAGDWGMQVSGIPGADDALVGAAGSAIEGANGAKAWAGLADDPFFFDFQGFNDTLATGTLAFDATRDSFKGTNVSAIVVEISSADLGDGIQVWGETRRIGGE